jgi:membrane fusion protein, multidrug efflux system
MDVQRLTAEHCHGPAPVALAARSGLTDAWSAVLFGAMASPLIRKSLMSPPDSSEPPSGPASPVRPGFAPESAPPVRRRTALQRLRLPIMGAVVLLALIGGLIVYLTGGRFESTDDAAVQGARVSVSSSIAGRVVNVMVHENQLVHAGEVLFQLDGRQYQMAYNEAQANVAAMRAQVEGLKATYRQRQADVKAAQDSLAYLESEAHRQKVLVEAGTASQSQADQAKNQADQARQQLAAMREQLANALAALGGDADGPTDHQPGVMQALARLGNAQINRSYIDIVAPQDGVVTKVDQLQVGDYINAATPVFQLVSNRLWVEANFKENQLEYMRAGQTATIKVDAFPDLRFKARVQAISPGTGSSFSLLPPENATGNWVKVTQRVPVRVEFDGAPQVPLQPGLSCSVSVDTTHHRSLGGGDSGPRAQASPAAGPPK